MSLNADGLMFTLNEAVQSRCLWLRLAAEKHDPDPVQNHRIFYEAVVPQGYTL